MKHELVQTVGDANNSDFSEKKKKSEKKIVYIHICVKGFPGATNLVFFITHVTTEEYWCVCIVVSHLVLGLESKNSSAFLIDWISST